MRQDIKTLKEKKAKNLRAIYRKLNSLQDAIYNLPKIKLDKPRFAGYKRYFILRSDIAKRKDSKIFLYILELLNTTVYSRTKDGFSKYDFDDPKMFCSKQRIKTLSVKKYEKLTPDIQKHFIKITNWDWRKKESRYEFLSPYMFVLKVKHHYITEVPVLDKELESQIGEIEDKIYRDNLRHKIDKVLGCGRRNRGYDDWDSSAKKKRLMDILLDEVIYDFLNGDINER